MSTTVNASTTQLTITPDNSGTLAFQANGVTVLNATSTAGVTFPVGVSVANTSITGNIISSQITSVANTQLTGLITSSQIASVPTTVATTYTATQSFAGTSSNEAIKLTNAAEVVTTNSTALSANTNFYVSNGSVQYWTANTVANTVLNITWSSGTTMSTAMAVNDSVTIAAMITNGTTAYYPTGYQIDGTYVTPKWQANSAPTGGNASSTDVYGLTIIKTAATPTYTVLASQTQFK
jgi:hypothetical protein